MDSKYIQYLNSQEWLNLRLDIITSRIKCERCGSKKCLQVHHKHYRTIYKENPEDLELLCKKCHESEHKIKSKTKKPKKKVLTLEQKVKLKAKKKQIKKKNKFRLKKKYGII